MSVVDRSNVVQLRAWNGELGAYWVERADRFDQGLAGYQQRLLAAAQAEERTIALDIGCGTGRTTRDLARIASAGTVTGVDLSTGMLELARQRALRDQVANVTFVQADAQVYAFEPGRFDLAVSRHGAIYFGDPAAAFGNIASALCPGGRLAMLSWQPVEHNEWMRTFREIFAAGRALPGTTPTPGSLSDPGQVRALLSGAGFAGIEVEGLRRPMYLGDDVEDAERFVIGQFGWMLRGVDASTVAKAHDELRENLRTHHSREGVHYGSAVWLITAVRHE
ncbi:class I SAM-dependent methyltransferase [Streptomyces sp. NPDC002004]